MSAILAIQVADEPAAALFVEGTLRLAIRECVLRRAALTGGFPSAAVDAVLAVAGLRSAEIDRIVVVGVGTLGPLDRMRRLTARLRPAAAKSEGSVRVRRGTPPPTRLDPAELARSLALAGLGHLRVVPIDAGDAAVACPPSLPNVGGALAVGAALAHDATLTVPVPSLWAPGFDDIAAYRALSNGELPRARVEDPIAVAAAALRAGRSVVWARGPAAFLDTPLGPRVFLTPGTGSPPPGWCGPPFGAANIQLLRAPDGIAAHSPTDVIRAFRALRADVLVLGDYVVER